MGFFSASSWTGEKQRQPTLARCGCCGLSKKCISPRMEPTGKGVRKVLFVAEAPGEQEDRKGTQLIGDAGQCLRKMLRNAGVNLDDCWKTNAVICRPPKNEISSLYVESCRPNLVKTILKLKPSVIVLLGESAVESLIPLEWRANVGDIGRWAGWRIPSHRFGAWLCPTYHPSYVKRMNEDKALVRIVEGHLGAALAMEGQPLPKTTLTQLEGSVACVFDDSEARHRLRRLATAEGTLAFDYEATGLKPDAPGHKIICCSFCLNGTETFACPITARTKHLLSAVLRNPRTRKVGSNIKFEQRWTMAMLGHQVENWYWDTMLTAHLLDNRPGITSVKFQAYVHFGVPDYAIHVHNLLKSRSKAAGANGINQIHRIPMKDLLLYCGMDSLVEYMVMEKQKEIMRWKE